jgi:tRNA-dihydrouridine synthase
MQMQINDLNSNQNGTTGNNSSDRSDLDELFSVAPMMGHTNRHYRYFYRLLSSKTHLYTEMIPASQIWAAYRRAREIYLPASKRSSTSTSTSMEIPHPEEIMEVVSGVIQDPSLEYTAAAHFDDRTLTLHQLLATSSLSPWSVAKGISENPVVLQLGGNNPAALSVASAIGSAWGAAESLVGGSTSIAAVSSINNPNYTSINLNCGCPSNAVGGRAGGCSLMGTPDLVARSVESMKKSIDDLWNNLEEAGPPPTVTVKNRLGIREAATYDAAKDRSKNDDEAFEDVSSFVRTVSLAGAVPKFHIHTRLGLLGDFREDGEDEERNEGKQKLWVPGSAFSEVPAVDRDSDASIETNAPRIKIDHKREQERARRRSRRATIKNREVPPLRPGVVSRLADAFPHLRFVANGGIDDLDHVKKVVEESQYRSSNGGGIIGAMVGRAAINHPCSFAAADSVLWGSENQAAKRRPTRGEVLENYIAYCETEESLIESYGASPLQLESLRKRLVAVPFHLFTGEEGSDEFQRRLKKLRDTKMNGRNQNQKKKNKKSQIQMKAASILRAASSFVPMETLDKTVDDFVPWEDVAKFEGGLKRGSALQRVVY